MVLSFLRSCVTRSFHTHIRLLRRAASQHQTFAQDTLIYSSAGRKNFCRLVSLAGVSQGAFWACAAYFATDLREDPPATEPLPDLASRPLAPLWKRTFFASLSIGIGCTFVLFGWFLPRRFIHTLRLVEQGTQLEIGTFTTFGQRNLKVPLRDVQFLSSGNSKNLALRLTGKRFAFLLETVTEEGQGGVIDPHALSWVERAGGF
eukprot:m.233830 g.233830  ORF g.233830 m.233830 type:complete len:204 (-) comp26511_c4_seq4:93-704(-)